MNPWIHISTDQGPYKFNDKLDLLIQCFEKVLETGACCIFYEKNFLLVTAIVVPITLMCLIRYSTAAFLLTGRGP